MNPPLALKAPGDEAIQTGRTAPGLELTFCWGVSAVVMATVARRRSGNAADAAISAVALKASPTENCMFD